MDIGGFRDMHRHRRCVQLIQGFTTAHGYDDPEGLAEAGLEAAYELAMLDCPRGLRNAAPQAWPPNATASADYLLPLGTRTRALFKMDFAEAVYISETPLPTPGTLLLSPHRLGDVRSRPQSSTRPRAVLPRDGCQ